MYLVTTRLKTPATQNAKSECEALAQSLNCSVIAFRNNHFQICGGDQESVLDVLASLEDAGLIENELQVGCSIRCVRASAPIELISIEQLRAAIEACSLTNCFLSYVAANTYTVESQTLFAVKNALAYIFPERKEADLNRLIEEI